MKRPSSRLMALVLLLLVALPGVFSVATAEELSLRGRVTGDDGAPLADARVSLWTLGADPAADDPLAEVRSDAAGAFLLAAPGAGRYLLRIDAPGWVPTERSLDPLIETRELPAAELEPSRGLALTAVDGEGRAVAGALVRMDADRGPRFFGDGPEWRRAERIGWTDGDGALELPRGRNEAVVLRVLADGFAPLTLRRLPGQRVTARLRPGRSVALEVRDSAGSPREGVSLTGDDDFPLGRTGADGRALVACAAGEACSLRASTASGLTASAVAPVPAEGDGGGRFGGSATGASRGTASASPAAADTGGGRFRGEAGGNAATTGGDRPGADGGDGAAMTGGDQPTHDLAGAAPLILRLPPSGTIEGRVVDGGRGAAVEGAVVRDLRNPRAVAISGRRGAFRMEVPAAGIVELSASAPGFLPSLIWRGSLEASLDHGPALALRPAAEVSGRVLGEDGEPLAGARLTVRPAPDRSGMMRVEIGRRSSPPTATSAADGSYRLGPLGVERPLLVEARHPGHAPAERELGQLEPYERRSGVDLELPAGLSLAGSVVSRQGDPLAGAEVELRPAAKTGGGMFFAAGGESEPLARAATNAQGEFLLADLAPGAFDIEATRPGYARTVRRGVQLDPAAAETRIDPLVLEPSVPVEGWVLDENGEPLEGAEITVKASGKMSFTSLGVTPGTREADAVTGPDGWFRVDGHRRGEKVTVDVTRAGFGVASRDGLELPLNSPVEITMTPASTVSGLVLDEDGQPVAAATVNLTRTVMATFGGNSIMMSTRMDDETDAEGAFTFDDLEPGKIGLEASASGFTKTSLSNLEIPHGEDLTGVVLTLEQGAIAVGQVLEASGRPAVGARVRALDEEEAVVQMGGAVTDGDGWFRLDGLAAGEVSIEARDERGSRAVRDVTLERGTNRVDLSFEGGQPLSGVVIRDGGAPAGGAWVSLAAADRPWQAEQATAGPDGSFTFRGVRPGHYQLRAGAPGAAQIDAPQAVEVGESPVSGVELRLGAAGSLTGRVLGLDERDLPSVRVTAAHQTGEQFESAVVDHEGSYRFDELMPGHWSVRARIESGGRQARGEVDVPPGGGAAVLDLEFRGGVSLSGVALRGDAPLERAVVSAYGEDVDSSGWARTDAEGRFFIGGLEPGRYRVELRQWTTGLSYQEQLELDGDREIEIELPEASIEGRVIDALTREAIEGAQITLEPAGDRSGMPGVLGGVGATTDAQGYFNLTPVTDGAWQLHARRRGYAATTQPVTVQGGETQGETTLALEPTEGLMLEARGPGGRAPDRVRLALLDAAGATVLSGAYATGENGRVRVSTAPAGSFTLLVGADGLATTRVEVSLPGPSFAVTLPAPTSLGVSVAELRESGGSASVTVFDSGGQPLRLLGWAGQVTSSWRLRGGELQLGGLPPGRYTVEVRAEDGGHWSGEVTTSSGATARLEL